MPTREQISAEFEEMRARLADEVGGRPASNEPASTDFGAEFDAMQSARQAAAVSDDELALDVGVGGLGPPLGEPMTRMALGAADTYAEQSRVFRKIYPEGELHIVRSPQRQFTQPTIRLPGEAQGPPPEVTKTIAPETMLFRRSPAEPWGRVNDDSRTELGDFTEFFADDLGTFLGELILFKGNGGALWKGLQAFVGTVFGDTAQQAAEDVVFDINDEPWDQVSKRTFTKGVAAGVTTAALNVPIATAERLVRGKGIGITPEAETALAASREIGLEDVAPLTSAQISDNPIVNRLESLSAQVSGKVKERVTNQQRFMTGKFDEKIAEGDSARFMDGVAKAYDDMESSMVSELERLSQRGVDFEVAGQQLTTAYNQFAASSKKAVDALYQNARSQGEPRFHLGTVLDDDGATLADVAAEQLVSLRRVLPQRKQVQNDAGVMEEKVGMVATDPRKDQADGAAVVRILGNIMNLPDELTAMRVSPKEVFQGAGPGLERLAGEGGDFIVQPVDYLRGIRSDLFDLAQPDQAGKLTTANRAAAITKSYVDKLLDNPVAGSTAAYREANRVARQRYETLEDSIVTRIAKSDRPNEIAAAVVQPGRGGNERTLKMVRKISTPEQFEDIQNAWLNDLIRQGKNGSDINKILGDYTDGTLEQLISQSDLHHLRHFGGELNRLNTGAVRTALEQESRYVNTLHKIIGSNSTRQIDDFANMVRASDEGTQRSVRAAMWEWAARDMIVTSDKGVKILSPASTQATMDKIQRLGLDQFFPSADDAAMLRALPTLAPFIRSTTDAGSALAGAQVVAGVRGALNPFTTDAGQLASAVGHLVEMLGLGRMMIDPRFRRFVIGHSTRGFSAKPKNAMRFIAAYAATTATQLIEEGENLGANHNAP